MSQFGDGFMNIWPRSDTGPQFNDFGRALLEKCQTVEKPDPEDDAVDIKTFMKASSSFPLEFGTNTCRVVSQPLNRHEHIRKQIVTAYPVMHERALALYLNFLEHKCQYGNQHELPIYQNLTLTEFVQRLLAKRCAAFFSRNDKYLLVTRERGASGFMQVGCDSQTPPLLLENVLSFDEIKLSALLSVSSHTELINDGSRANCGVIERDKTKIERVGVVVGMIGARLSRRDVMEFQDIIITRTQNTSAHGYGHSMTAKTETREQDYRRLWRNFYEEPDHLYANVTIDHKRFGESRNKDDIFDHIIMKKRYAISFDTLLLECQARAVAAGKQAYLHVVGIGLGVWRVADQQELIFLATFQERLKHLLPKLTHIDFVHFSWFKLNEYDELQNNAVLRSDAHPNGGIRIFISKRNPADKLRVPERDPNDLLLVISYPWDGNALPGNEFWMRMLKSTGDSSTACSTLITELQNPHINTNFVNSDNLHIVSEQYGLLHIAEYANKVLT